MRIVIPMSGMGNRFIRAGYSTPKTLLEAEGKPVIEHVVNMFPGEERFLFIINKEHDETTDIREVLQRIAPKGEIAVIEPHKKGPVWATLQVIDRLDPDEPTIVNYCDFSVGWNYAHFVDTMISTDVAGCVTAYRGFHPHSLGSTLYAYMRSEDEQLLEITEKAHFTDDRMAEYASSGTYYFGSGRLVAKYFERLVERNIDLNGEYYVSLVYNLLVEDGLPVSVYQLDQFLQWGTPEDWQEYQSWSQHFAEESCWRPASPPVGQVLVPMAGEGVRFRDDGYEAPKPLIPVGDEHMVVRATRSLPAGETTTFVVRQELLDSSDVQSRLEAEFGYGTNVIGLEESTEGQACTCLMARDHLDP